MRATGSELASALYDIGFRFMIGESRLFIIDPYGRTIGMFISKERAERLQEEIGWEEDTDTTR